MAVLLLLVVGWPSGAAFTLWHEASPAKPLVAATAAVVALPKWELAHDAVDPYSAIPSAGNLTGAPAGAVHLRGGQTPTYTDFFSVKMCFPGYASPACSERLQVANPWYTQDCPNLQDTYGNTMDVDVPESGLGGRTGCPGGTDGLVAPCAYLCYAHMDYGTAVIPKSIWRNAQTSELNWASSSADQGVSDDRSWEHWEGFHQFQSIPQGWGPLSLIEVGAGPWTQTKGLLEKRPDLQLQQFTIFEPMAAYYQQHVSTCSYKTGRLQKFRSEAGFHDFPVHIIGQGGELLLSHQGQYDALLVTNVIEHVQNAFSFLIGLHRVLKPGGLLIFHERFFASPPAGDGVLGTGALHPIRLTRHVLDLLLTQFTPLLQNDAPTMGMTGRKLGEQGYYFIGQKK